MYACWHQSSAWGLRHVITTQSALASVNSYVRCRFFASLGIEPWFTRLTIRPLFRPHPTLPQIGIIRPSLAAVLSKATVKRKICIMDNGCNSGIQPRRQWSGSACSMDKAQAISTPVVPLNLASARPRNIVPCTVLEAT